MRLDWRGALPVILSVAGTAVLASIASDTPRSADRKRKEGITEGGTGTRAKGEAGTLGAPDPHIARSAGLREAAEFGMIGLIGAGTGGGRGEGIGLTTIGTIGHGAGSPDVNERQGPSGVRAGEWDDNASYREFRRLLGSKAGLGFRPLDVSNRQFVVVRDAAGKAIPSCDVTIRDARGASTTLRTMSTGRAILFPHGEGLTNAPYTASVRCGGNAMSTSWEPADERVVELRGKEPRDAIQTSIDIGFALDTTGSMSEEIAAVKSTLRKVAASLDKSASVRVGLVEYKDRGDEFVTRVYPMDEDIDAFVSRVNGIAASGGGDLPESMAAGMHDAVTKLTWRDTATARLLFVIADAPPHLDYQDEPDYRADARAAARRGIQIHAIAASGMDELGQIVFRQIAQYTGGTEMFVLRGGAGPESAGGGDPLSSRGGTQKQYSSGNLDALILAHVDAARRAIDEDPTAIRGLHKDFVPPACARQ